jgi:hypothetical protein
MKCLFKKMLGSSFIIWYFFVGCMYATSIYSQTIQETKIMGVPQGYIRPEMENTEDNSMGILTGSRWEVFSDRPGNNTCTDFTGKTTKYKAGFLESFYVTNEVEGYLHIYSEPLPGNSGILSPKAIDKGWIKKSAVLLWRNCIISNSNKRQILVMTYGNPDLFDSAMLDGVNQNGVDIFYDPFLKEKRNIKTQFRKVYFVYKKVGDAILLGEKKRISINSDPAPVILGWVPLEYCYFLNTRVWVCANKNPEGIKEMDIKKVVPSLFIEESQAMTFNKTMDADRRYIIWQETPDQNNRTLYCFPEVSKKDKVVQVKVVENNFETGFAPLQPDSMKYPVFIEVALITNDDLSSVVSNIKKLQESAGDLYDREEIKKCLINLYKNEYSGLSDDYIKNLTLREVLDGILWMTNSPDPFLNNPVRRITDSSLIDDIKIIELFNKIKTSVVEMNKILSNDVQTTRYSYISNGIRYYWIASSLFF